MFETVCLSSDKTSLFIVACNAAYQRRPTPELLPARLRVSLLRQGLIPIAGGAIPGIAAAVLSGRLLENLVDGAKSVNATTYAASVLFIAVIAATGIRVATRPIARLDIVEILQTNGPGTHG